MAASRAQELAPTLPVSIQTQAQAAARRDQEQEKRVDQVTVNREAFAPPGLAGQPLQQGGSVSWNFLLNDMVNTPIISR